MKDQREVDNILENETQPSKLVADWATVKKASNHIDKHWQSWKRKAPTTIEPFKSINNLDNKAMKETIMEELSKKFEVVSLANSGRCGPKEKKRIDLCGAPAWRRFTRMSSI